MGKKITAYKVNRLNDVKTKNYTDGDVFLTNRSIAILKDGKMNPLLTKEEVEKMINDKVGGKK